MKVLEVEFIEVNKKDVLYYIGLKYIALYGGKTESKVYDVVVQNDDGKIFIVDFEN